MANEFYISAGPQPEKEGDTPVANTFYISAGLAPVVASGASAALTGTAITGGVLESEIVTGGETIIITLTGDTFVTGTTSEDGIAAGMNGSASWNSEVRDNTDNTDIVLSGGDTVATITLPAAAAYDISADDTITITIPAASLTAGEAIVCDTFNITNETDGIVIFRRRINKCA